MSEVKQPDLFRPTVEQATEALKVLLSAHPEVHNHPSWHDLNILSVRLDQSAPGGWGA
jgi:hypothetical protein